VGTASRHCCVTSEAPVRGGRKGRYLPGGVSVADGRSGLMRRNGPAVVGRLPGTPGVYRFRDAGNRVLYIGRAGSLRRRVASYWSDLGERGHLAAMVARIVRIEAVSCGSAHEAVWLERNLLETSLPPWNRTPGGLESAVYIRLDAGPIKPGLSVAFQA